jgi:hypothetical protein
MALKGIVVAEDLRADMEFELMLASARRLPTYSPVQLEEGEVLASVRYDPQTDRVYLSSPD